MTGLVLGRFQPLHPGHLRMIETAMYECDKVVVCIGSAQRAEPFTIEERLEKMQKQLALLYKPDQYRIVTLVDPVPMEKWPAYVNEQCGLLAEKEKRFYRSDRLAGWCRQGLQELGYCVRYVDREKFYYRGPDGLYYRMSSATEIRELHLKLKVPL
jgi:cytidyltransferase-like protein